MKEIKFPITQKYVYLLKKKCFIKYAFFVHVVSKVNLAQPGFKPGKDSLFLHVRANTYKATQTQWGLIRDFKNNM